jgi:hypothetical protein
MKEVENGIIRLKWHLQTSFFLFVKSSIWVVSLELHFWKLIYDQGKIVHEISKVERHLQFILVHLSFRAWIAFLKVDF